MKKPKSEFYVNNKEFYESLVAYKKKVAQAARKKEPPPPIPEDIGRAFLLIARRIATRPNFFGYSYRDEMISDGVENCVCQVKSFDPKKSNNPFGYFTMIIMNAFLRRLKKEKRQQDIRRLALENLETMDGYSGGALLDRDHEPVKLGDGNVSGGKRLYHSRSIVKPKKAVARKTKTKPKTKTMSKSMSKAKAKPKAKVSKGRKAKAK